MDWLKRFSDYIIQDDKTVVIVNKGGKNPWRVEAGYQTGVGKTVSDAIEDFCRKWITD